VATAGAAAGFLAGRLWQLGGAGETERRRIIEDHKSAVLRESSALARVLRADAASWREAKEHLSSLRKFSPDAQPQPNFNFNFAVVDTPALILATPDVDAGPITVSPWNNVAKLTAEWSTPSPDNGPYGLDGVDSLRYVFAWQNPSDRYVVINAESYLLLNGFCDILAATNNRSHLSLSAAMSLWQWWNSPPTLAPSQASAGVTFANLAVSAGPFDPGESQSQSIGGIYDLTYQLFLMPPRGVVVFEVSLIISHYTDGGWVEVDFASGDFETMCPAVVLAIVS
jgi:hypothetical protein